MSAPTLVLNDLQVRQKINRIAHELYENYFEDGELIVVGIEDRGAILADRLCKVLKDISELDITQVSLKLDKDAPLASPIELSVDAHTLENKPVVIVDDVLNSGKTLIYAVNHLLQVMPSKVSTVVLVDRRHRRFPIRADFVGLTLSTTLQEHINVEFGEEDAVYLN